MIKKIQDIFFLNCEVFQESFEVQWIKFTTTNPFVKIGFNPFFLSFVSWLITGRSQSSNYLLYSSTDVGNDEFDVIKSKAD